MKKTAIYPGTFDPVTYGHIDVIQKSLKIVDKLIVAISNGNQKRYLFSIDERIEIVKKALFSDLRFNKNKIKVISFNSLTTDLCSKYKSNIILRGLRAASDFEYEFQMTQMNRHLNSKIETVFLMPNQKFFFTSSNLIKQVFKFTDREKKLIPGNVHKALIDHYK